jgi:hypothetical protein
MIPQCSVDNKVKRFYCRIQQKRKYLDEEKGSAANCNVGSNDAD